MLLNFGEKLFASLCVFLVILGICNCEFDWEITKEIRNLKAVDRNKIQDAINTVEFSTKEDEHEKDIKDAIASFGQIDVKEKEDKVDDTPKEKEVKEDIHCSDPRLYVQYEDEIWFCESKTPEISIHYFNQNKKKKPIVMVDKDARFGKFYSLVLVDPDAPNRDNPVNKHWIHWGVMNIPGRYFIHGAFDPNETDLYEEFVGYEAPSPPKGSGPHRYTMIAYEQEDFILHVDGHNHRRDGRAKFNLAAYTLMNDLHHIANATFTSES